ncbi:hypothetical protein Mal35_08520 [Gimesia maris]|uniref:hypothetical protein n=1 Tax=Gimesia maris TaxID=122 RepID=UPI001187CFCB|nr:hypothetical protein [Gimesia maris]QDT77426.1 hypothetical protein Mal35_08520 [Gimesia maris]
MTRLHAKTTTIIHIVNYPYLTPEVFGTQLKDQNSKCTQKQIDKAYSYFLKVVETAQQDQIVVLRHLIKKYKLKAVYTEGLTEKNHPEIMKSIESIKEFEKTKEDPIDENLEFLNWQGKLSLGAAGRLVVNGELETLLVTEDSEAFEASNPVRSDGWGVFDKNADERREDAIVVNLLKGSGVVVIVLGEDHDLRENLKRLGASVKYKRVIARNYKP